MKFIASKVSANISLQDVPVDFNLYNAGTTTIIFPFFSPCFGPATNQIFSMHGALRYVIPTLQVISSSLFNSVMRNANLAMSLDTTEEYVRLAGVSVVAPFTTIRHFLEKSIFDVKMDFSIKCRMVANGATTETPASLTYSSVVSRDSARLAFLIAELNKIYAMTCDVGNAYLNAPCREKI